MDKLSLRFDFKYFVHLWSSVLIFIDCGSGLVPNRQQQHIIIHTNDDIFNFIWVIE